MNNAHDQDTPSIFRQSFSVGTALEIGFRFIALLAVAVPLLTLAYLLFTVFSDGLGRLDWEFITSLPDRKPEDAGVLTGLLGTTWALEITART